MNDSTDPASLATITYTPFGSVSTLQNGCVGSGCTPPQESYFYNKRLQPAVIELGNSASHAADYCRVYNYYVGVTNASACSETPSNWPQASNNDGDVAGYYYNDNVNSLLSHAAKYTYDSVNRLTNAVATGNWAYNQTYTGDGSNGQYGNMDCTASPAEVKCLAPTYSATTNRITTSGYSYDAAGNVTGDRTNTYQWDAEARLTKVINGKPATISTNTYNALGQRVRDVTASATTDEAYGAGGNLLWRYMGSSSTNRSFVPFNGGILAEYYSGGTLFDHSDELGSITTSTSYNGGLCQEQLFYPFGQLWTGAGSCGMHQTFAQLPDYDAETDQYNTLNRHYTPMGRWMSPDPGNAGARPTDPQTWNMYAYALNNPTTLTDPTGERYQVCQTDTNGNETNCADISDAQFGQLEEENKNTLTFAANGGILQNGTVIGSYQQTSVDLPQDAQAILGSVYQTAAGPVNFFAGATMAFLGVFGPGMLESTLEVPEIGGLGLGAAGRGAGLGARPSAPPNLSNLSPKIQNDMAQRGWTPQDIENAYRNGVPSQVVDRTAGFTPATQYLDPATGKFVVVNNQTGNVIQVSGAGFLPNPPVK